MPILGASFQIGRSALNAYQAALAITGQNIANLGNADYARQTASLAAAVGGPLTTVGRPGAGVNLTAIRRHVDAALENRLRLALGTRSGAEALSGALTQVETLYNELSDADISTQLNTFFAGFGTLQTDPSDSGLRTVTLSNVQALVQSFQRVRGGLADQISGLNDQIRDAADEINRLSDQIASLNAQIVRQEADGRSVASALRDQRDAALRELAGYIDIQTREQEGGSLLVYVGSEPLVQFDRSRGVTVRTQIVNGVETVDLRFADNDSSLRVGAGRLGGLVRARDNILSDQIGRLDQLAAGLIYEVNRLHTTGVGLVAHTSLTSRNAVSDADQPLNQALSHLPFPVENGVVIVKVRDQATGQVTTRQIEIDLDGLNDDDTTLNDLAASLDAIDGLSASVTTDGRLKIDADAGREFWFSDDSSGVLAALNLGGLFVGTDAATIDLDPAIEADPRLIATSQSGLASDGDLAGRIAQLAQSDATSTLLSGMSIPDFHQDIVNRLGSASGAAQREFESADAVYAGLVAQRESVSGVNADEEAINLTRFERAYQSAARYLSVLDQLSQEVLNLV